MKRLILGSIGLFLVGCQSVQPIKPLDPTSVTPAQFQALQASAQAFDNQSRLWFGTTDKNTLPALMVEAEQANHSLAQQRAEIARLKAQAGISRADRLPTLDLSIDAQRNGAADNRGGEVTNSYDAGLAFGWQPDIWGKLSERERAARLSLSAAQAQYQQQSQSLAADIAKHWFTLIADQQLLALLAQRQDNLKANLDIIERGYRQGLYEALDVYLARNDVNAQAAELAQQQQLYNQHRREIEQLLGRYPSAQLSATAELPALDDTLTTGMPADLLRRRFDLQAAWLNLLAADASLAAAYWDRFPSFSLNANYGGSSDHLGQVVASGNLAWMLAAGVSQSLFDAGRRELVQESAQASRDQVEQQYLEQIFSAFTDVENALNQDQALAERYQRMNDARINARSAEELAFGQYTQGLETYTTVLEAQRRSVDAQTRVINLQQQRINNRIDLFVALGGDLYASALMPEPNMPSSSDHKDHPL